MGGPAGLYWKHCNLHHTSSLTLTLTMTHSCPAAARPGLRQGRGLGSPFWSLVPQGFSDSHSVFRNTGLSLGCHWVTAGTLLWGRKRQSHGLGSWAGAWREEAGLGRVGLALAEFFFSLWMMRPTHGWSGGAQSSWPLRGEPGDKGQRSEKTEAWNSVSQQAQVGRTATGDHIWEPISGTSLQGFSLAKRRDKEVRVCFTKGRWGSEVDRLLLNSDGRQPAAILEGRLAVGSHQEYRDGRWVTDRQQSSMVGTSQSWWD